jgi:hypothetical protein
MRCSEMFFCFRKSWEVSYKYIILKNRIRYSMKMKQVILRYVSPSPWQQHWLWPVAGWVTIWYHMSNIATSARIHTGVNWVVTPCCLEGTNISEGYTTSFIWNAGGDKEENHEIETDNKDETVWNRAPILNNLANLSYLNIIHAPHTLFHSN